MNGLNRVTLLGNLGQDPELKTIAGGSAVLNMRLATTETYLDRNNERQERTDWHTVVLWGKRAEALAKYLHKGSRILVEGRISTRSYEKNGEKRYATDITATNIVLCDSKKGDGVDDPYASRDSAGSGGKSSGGGRSAPAGPSYGPDAGADDFGSGGDDEIPFATTSVVPRREQRIPKWERW